MGRWGGRGLALNQLGNAGVNLGDACGQCCQEACKKLENIIEVDSEQACGDAAPGSCANGAPAADTVTGFALLADTKDCLRKDVEVHCGKQIADRQLFLTKDDTPTDITCSLMSTELYTNLPKHRIASSAFTTRGTLVFAWRLSRSWEAQCSGSPF